MILTFLSFPGREGPNPCALEPGTFLSSKPCFPGDGVLWGRRGRPGGLTPSSGTNELCLLLPAILEVSLEVKQEVKT